MNMSVGEKSTLRMTPDFGYGMRPLSILLLNTIALGYERLSVCPHQTATKVYNFTRKEKQGVSLLYCIIKTN